MSSNYEKAMPKIAFYTLGCKSNQYETDRMVKTASDAGSEIVPYPGPADIYVINTCTVTGNADKKSRHAVRYAKKTNPSAKVIVTGCYAETGEFNMKEADIIVANKDKLNIARYLTDDEQEIRNEKKTTSHFSLPTSNFSHIRANLMIENGCENFCSYCIVPHVRGKITSMPFDNVIAEAEQMVKDGVKEIVLTGINIGEYAPGLAPLLNELSRIDGLLRIRISSIEPKYVDDALIRAVKEDPKVCKHLHIPLQSGDDGILKAMNRDYSAKDFLSLTKKIKEQIKDVAITTDIIIGFPGEDEKAFKNTLKLIDKIQFSRIHIFSYSDRPGTPASLFNGKLDPKVISKRRGKLEKVREKCMLKFQKSFLRKAMDVLIEQRNMSNGKYEGMTSNYIRVFLTGSGLDDKLIGRIIPVKFKDCQVEHVIASPVLV
jgi:threonylcarbamoyladenosine tRNA methylthiotransferase MtaB